ncbi:hypothetical protein BJ875DRAFT_450375 [Amylocarpus encephaloides]|uniref:CFEM domain-containing protein n=1 Tax=Amylocarpus encephaloides TaxID=45428 RepID=A0A9P8C9N3_9HELO|nr:hypothetical protein BJ875DRAFT_450375 [Amylocarpus encephaloides]
MKFTILATVACLAHLAAAQIDGLPTCAQSCVTKFTTGSNIGGCPSINIQCICSSPTFLSGIACCLSGVCSASDQTAAVTFAKNFCSISGVTGLPDSVVCSSASSSATSAPASTSPSASSTGSVTSGAATTSTTSGGGSATGAAVSSGSSVASSVSSAGASVTSSAAAATGSSGAHKVEGMGAGIFGALAMGLAIL